jgi:hypothetical protein
MKRGACIVNTARGKIADRDAIVRALESGQLAGYAEDVWFPQPAPADHPWRTMPHHGMTPHISGTSLSAQARYAAGTREILECWLDGYYTGVGSDIEVSIARWKWVRLEPGSLEGADLREIVLREPSALHDLVMNRSQFDAPLTLADVREET